VQPDALNNIIDLYMGRRHVISGNILAEGVKLLRETAPGLKEADLREKFRRSMYEGMETAERNLPKTHADSQNNRLRSRNVPRRTNT
jgi:predicted phage tail protein